MFSALFLLVSTLQAQITYIDAVEGADGNTFATGMAAENTDWIHPSTSFGKIENQWKKRPFANGGTIFASHTASDGVQRELTTRITPPSGGLYRIWVFFWDAEGGNQWDIAAGLHRPLTQQDVYSFDGLGNTEVPVAASTLTFA